MVYRRGRLSAVCRRRRADRACGYALFGGQNRTPTQPVNRRSAVSIVPRQRRNGTGGAGRDRTSGLRVFPVSRRAALPTALPSHIRQGQAPAGYFEEKNLSLSDNLSGSWCVQLRLNLSRSYQPQRRCITRSITAAPAALRVSSRNQSSMLPVSPVVGTTGSGELGISTRISSPSA